MNSANKSARFIRFCDAFNIPLINFVDSLGYYPGKEQEHKGAVRNFAKNVFAYCEATVPRIALIVGKVYGGAISGMGVSKALGTDLTISLPYGEIAVMSPEAAVDVLYQKEISTAEKKEELRDEKIKEYKEKFANPYVAAEKGWIDAVIEPNEIRQFLITSLKRLKNKKEITFSKKHGNIPL